MWYNKTQGKSRKEEVTSANSTFSVLLIDPMRILFVAGGTAGPLTPLIAVVEEIRRVDSFVECHFVVDRGTAEKALIEAAGFPYSVHSSGKLRRYLSIWNVVDVFRLLFSYFSALRHLRILQPDLAVMGGSYNGVPYLWAAKTLGIPTAVHQQDVQLGLANRLVLRGADYASVAFSLTLQIVSKLTKNAAKTGNPVRSVILHGNAKQARQVFQLSPNLPVLLALGGSSGALGLNTLVTNSLEQLLDRCQIIHVLGNNATSVPSHERYHPVPFLTKNIADAYAVADIVVTRAGVGTLSELAVLAKPAIIVPMPGTHQEANARYFGLQNAAIVLDQHTVSPQQFTGAVLDLLRDPEKQGTLAKNIRTLNDGEAAATLARQYLFLAKKA